MSQSVLIIRPFGGKTAKRRTFANFGQSSVTKTLPYIQVGRNGKNGNERANPQLKSSAKIARLRDNGKKKGKKMSAWNLSRPLLRRL